jgi:hypothetical protein
MGIVPAPPAPFPRPEEFGQPVVALVLLWTGDPAEGERALAPLRRVGTPLADVVRLVPYLALQSMLDPGAPHGRHYYWKAHRLPLLSDEVIEIRRRAHGRGDVPVRQINGSAVGGAASRVGADATAV